MEGASLALAHKRIPLVSKSQRRIGRFGALLVALIDQGSQSTVNLLLSVFIANELSAENFGRFSAVFVLLTVCWGSWRALMVEPFMTASSGAEPDLVLLMARSLVTKMLLGVGLPMMLVFLSAGFVLDGVLSSTCYMFAISGPFLVGLDGVRAVNLAAKRGRTTFLMGTVWVSLYSLSASVAWFLDSHFAVYGLLVGLCSIPSILVGLRGCGASGHSFEPGFFADGLPLIGEFLLVGLTIHSLSFFLPVVAGFEEAAGFRGAVLLAGPIVTLMGGLRLGMLADAKRYQTRCGDDSWQQYLIRTSAAFVGLGLIVFVAINVLAISIGDSLLGATWPYAKSAVLPFSLAVVVTAVHLTTGTVLRVRGMADVVLKTRAIQLPLAVLPSFIGAVVLGAFGAALGFLVGTILVTPVWVIRSLGRK